MSTLLAGSLHGLLWLRVKTGLTISTKRMRQLDAESSGPPPKRFPSDCLLADMALTTADPSLRSGLLGRLACQVSARGRAAARALHLRPEQVAEGHQWRAAACDTQAELKPTIVLPHAGGRKRTIEPVVQAG